MVVCAVCCHVFQAIAPCIRLQVWNNNWNHFCKEKVKTYLSKKLKFNSLKYRMAKPTLKPSEIQKTIILLAVYNRFISANSTSVFGTAQKQTLAYMLDKSDVSAIWIKQMTYKNLENNSRCSPIQSTKINDLLGVGIDQFECSSCKTFALLQFKIFVCLQLRWHFLVSANSWKSETDAFLTARYQPKNPVGLLDIISLEILL